MLYLGNIPIAGLTKPLAAVRYNVGGTTDIFRFVYAQGSESEAQ